MSWFRTLKFAAYSDYWVLPDGTEVDANHGHVPDGWWYLAKTEGATPPSEFHWEDYEPFKQRHWIRISMNGGVNCWSYATPQQAAKVAELISDQISVWFDLPNGQYVAIPGSEYNLIVAALTGKMSPAQIKMRVPQYARSRNWLKRAMLASQENHRLAMPMLEEKPNYVSTYMDIGHPDWTNYHDRYEGRESEDIRLWAITPDFQLHVTEVQPAENENELFNHSSWENNLKADQSITNEFLLSGRYERNNQHPQGICTIVISDKAMFKKMFRFPRQQETALSRAEAILDKQFGNPAIVMMSSLSDLAYY